MKQILVLGLALSTVATAAIAGPPREVGGPIVTVSDDGTGPGPAKLGDSKPGRKK